MILVVDDDRDRLRMLRFVLAMFGFEVIAARSPQEVLQCVAERLPDLIITDSAVPSMSALELCRVLRASQKTRRIPVILHTGVQMPDDVPRLYDQIITRSADVDAFAQLYRGLLLPGMSGAR